MRKLRLKQGIYKPQYTSPPSPRTPTKRELAEAGLPLDSISDTDGRLEGQLLLLEERTKGIQLFYEKKLSQLQSVLLKQKETKHELTHQLFQLSQEHHNQQQHLGHLRKTLQGSLNDPLSKGGRQKRSEYIQHSRSKGKGMLFGSGVLKQSLGSSSRLVMKKCKSSGAIASEYFPIDGLTISQTHHNPQSVYGQHCSQK